MGRAGIWHERAVGEIRKILGLGGIRVSGIFSHLSSADEDAEYTRGQFEIFRRTVSHFDLSGMLVHLHNSAALRYVKVEPPFNAVRMGLLQYGINPFPDGEYAGIRLESGAFLQVQGSRGFVARVEEDCDGWLRATQTGCLPGLPTGRGR